MCGGDEAVCGCWKLGKDGASEDTLMRGLWLELMLLVS